MRRGIYIGSSRVKKLDGVLAGQEAHLNFGMTGGAVPTTKNKTHWDFRPDGFNIQFIVPRDDVWFDDQDSPSHENNL